MPSSHTRAIAVRLREAVATDALALARLHTASWRASYRGMLSDAYLDGDIEGDRAGFWRETLALSRPGQVVIVAESAGELAGFVHFHGNHDPAWGTYVHALHVARPFQGQGVGARLMDAVGAWCEAHAGDAGIWLWVLEPNGDARRFYERIGARNAGRDLWEAPDGSRVPKFRYAWVSPQDLRAGSAAKARA